MTVVLERQATAPAPLTLADVPAVTYDLLDDNGRRWRPIGGGKLHPVFPSGRVDRLVVVSVEAVELLCGPVRQVPVVAQ